MTSHADPVRWLLRWTLISIVLPVLLLTGYLLLSHGTRASIHGSLAVAAIPLCGIVGRWPTIRSALPAGAKLVLCFSTF